MLQLTISGRVGNDCEVRETNGQFANSFSVAHSHHYTDQNGQKVESTTWIRCTMWTKKNSIGTFIKKGMVVLVQGFPKARWWKNQANEVQSNIEVTVDKIEFLAQAPKKDASAPSSAPANNANEGAFAGTNDNPPSPEGTDDLPF